MKTSQALLVAVVVCGSAGGTLAGCGSDSASGNLPRRTDTDAGAGTGGSGPGEGGVAEQDGGPVCGDGIVSAGESCDRGITSGEPGACPTPKTCDDGDPCTKEQVDAAGTCQASCQSGGQVAADPSAKDACCPPGATADTDADCSADCGNGTLDDGESCDPAIASGAGACPTTCPDDGDPCTRDALVVADPCNPVCKTTTITTAASGDGCCPKGATRSNDDDCTAVCGNGVVEPGEDCEGTSATCAACQFVPTAFRLTTLTLLDPHTWVNVSGTCTDITAALNGIIHTNLTTDTSGGEDGGANGALDLSFALLFRPLDVTATAGHADFRQPICTAPEPPASCGPNPDVPATPLTYTTQGSGTCLEADPAHLTSTYTAPAPATAGAGRCFVTDEAALTLPLGGVELKFVNARMAGQWTGDPATGVVEGLFTGFMTAETAKATLLPASLPLVGGLTLADLFPPVTDPVCTGIDDRDTGPDGTTPGWWWHLNFTGAVVPWSK